MIFLDIFTKIYNSVFLKRFLLILFEFHIMHPSPTHSPVPLYLPFALATSLQNKQQQPK